MPKICEAVLAALDGDLPVLGVLQKADTEFLRVVAGHPRVRLVTVTVETGTSCAVPRPFNKRCAMVYHR